jgi:putative ABC transport system permease protein
MAVLGLSWPIDKGDWIPLVEGRPLGQSRFELIADQTLKLPLGKHIEIGNEVYQVVGISRGMISSAGDGIAFLSSADALAVQLDVPGEAVRLERAARESRGRLFDVANQQPALLENATRQSGQLPAIARPSISAVLITLEHPSDAKAVAEVIGGWTDVTVYTADEQRNLLLKGSVEKVRSQIGLFRILLTIIATIIMALILYTLTLDKLHSIALLKLIGASNIVLLGLILQQAMILGASGFAIAYVVGLQIFPRFPRRVIITSEDLIQLAAIVFVISIASSALGVWKAMVVSPNEALA